MNQRKNRATVDGAHLFIWVWLAASIVNFSVGVFVAGYSVLTELALHVVVFGVPAGVAWFLSSRFRPKQDAKMPDDRL